MCVCVCVCVCVREREREGGRVREWGRGRGREGEKTMCIYSNTKCITERRCNILLFYKSCACKSSGWENNNDRTWCGYEMPCCAKVSSSRPVSPNHVAPASMNFGFRILGEYSTRMFSGQGPPCLGEILVGIAPATFWNLLQDPNIEFFFFKCSRHACVCMRNLRHL